MKFKSDELSIKSCGETPIGGGSGEEGGIGDRGKGQAGGCHGGHDWSAFGFGALYSNRGGKGLGGGGESGPASGGKGDGGWLGAIGLFGAEGRGWFRGGSEGGLVGLGGGRKVGGLGGGNEGGWGGGKGDGGWLGKDVAFAVDWFGGAKDTARKTTFASVAPVGKAGMVRAHPPQGPHPAWQHSTRRAREMLRVRAPALHQRSATFLR